MEAVVIASNHLFELRRNLLVLSKHLNIEVDVPEDFKMLETIFRLENKLLETYKTKLFHEHYELRLKEENHKRINADQAAMTPEELKLFKEQEFTRFINHTPIDAWSDARNCYDHDLRIVQNALNSGQDPIAQLDMWYEK